MRLHKREGTTRSELNVILTSDRVELFISLVNAEGKPRIIFETGRTIAPDANDKPLLLILTEALSLAAEELLTEGLTHIVSKRIANGRFDSIEVFYGAPWYISKGRHVKALRPNASVISEESLQELMSQNIDGLLPPEMKDILILEQHAHGFSINGYPVENPVGMTGAEIGMHLFISAIDSATRDAVEGVLYGHFHTHTIEHHSILLPLVQTLRTMSTKENSYFLVDVSGYTTEISRIERGIILDTASFPEGYETSIARTAETLNRRPEEVKTLIKRPGDFGLAKEFDTAHDAALIGWSSGYAEALQALGGSTQITRTVLLADTPLESSFKREIVRMGGGSVFTLSKDAYLSFYDPAARPSARVLSALLALY